MLPPLPPVVTALSFGRSGADVINVGVGGWFLASSASAPGTDLKLESVNSSTCCPSPETAFVSGSLLSWGGSGWGAGWVVSAAVAACWRTNSHSQPGCSTAVSVLTPQAAV